MNLRRFYLLGAVALVAQLVITAWGLAVVGFGATVPIHWNAAGEPNGYGPAWLAFFMTPVITVGLVGLFALIPRIEPRRGNLLKSSPAYVTVATAMLVLMTLVHVAVVAAGAGYNVPITPIIGGGVGLLFVVLGNVMTTVHSNFMFGVRTPWTLTSELSWDKTHRLVGRLWVIGGIAMFLTSLLGQTELLVAVILLFTIGSVALGFVYSYQVWKTDPDKRSMGGDAQ
jgi:uncharacterized membrane protein